MRILWILCGFLAGLILFSAGARANWVAPHLVAYWRFDDGAGTTAADSSGNGLVGTLAGFSGNRPSWIAGQFGGALEFDRAVAEHVRIGGDNAVTKLAGGKSFSFWTRLPLAPSGSNGFISISKDNSNRWHIDDGDRSGRVIVVNQVGGVRSTAQVLTAPGVLTYGGGVWHHVVISDTGAGAGGASAYVDGVLAGTYDSFDYSGLPTDAVLRLGCRYANGVESMGGALDDIAVFGTALTATHVNALYSLGTDPGIRYDLGQVQGLFAAYA
ncbi:MAG: LamG-like jellyroll fold domain-containing protein, partial [Patescibacteria group bacterium]|nr:LamG-like jellyroll fold domain-containing protein [Patescibacteria group bacterium]